VVRERAGRSVGTYRRSGIDGCAGQVCDTVARVTGQPARSLGDLLQEVAPEVEGRVDSRFPDDSGRILIHGGCPPAFTPPQLLAEQAQ
jgi:hypothetical protein